MTVESSVLANVVTARDQVSQRRVICLCAEWCGVCRQYRAMFDALADKYPDIEFRWLDVEDEEEALGDYDVETFPTLLVAEGSLVRFLGPVLPQMALVEQLVQRIAQPSGTTVDAQAVALLQRIVQKSA